MSSLDLSRLDDLIVCKDGTMRDDVYLVDVNARCSEVLEQMKNDAEEQLKLLALQACKHGDIFHEFRREVAEDKSAIDPIRYNTIVRLRGNSLAMEWVRYVFRKKGSVGPKVFSSYVTKGTGLKYPMQRFSKAEDSELKYIQLVEDRYAEIRKAAASLRKLRSAISEFERDLEIISAPKQVPSDEH